MRIRISMTDAARNFADYVNRAAFRGERFVLVRGRREVAELTPVPAGRNLGELAGLLADLPRLSDAEARAFAADLDRARSELPSPGDPWAS